MARSFYKYIYIKISDIEGMFWQTYFVLADFPFFNFWVFGIGVLEIFVVSVIFGHKLIGASINSKGSN